MAFRSNYRKEKYDRIENDNDGGLLKWAAELEAIHSKYIFCRWNNLTDVPKPKSYISWVKNNWSMGDLKHEHARQSEQILFYPGPKHFFPAKRPTDIVSYPRSGNKRHPTEKPVDLMRHIVGWTSGRVFDPFMGSGSTGVACVLEGRPFVGVEINEGYFKIAVERITEAINTRMMEAA